jgi:hypothetical protein
MTTSYPAAIDTTTSLPTITNDSTDVSGDLINSIRDAVLAVETELGISPKGTYATLKARLDAIGTGGSSITWANDLAGSSDTSQTVVSLQSGAVSINTSGLFTWGSAKTPQFFQDQLPGTGAGSSKTFTISAQNGQNQTGANNNNAGGILYLQSGAPGTGGSGTVARNGEIQLFAGATKIGGFSGNPSDILYVGGQTSGTLNPVATSYGASNVTIGTDVAFSYTISQTKRSGTGTNYGSNIVLRAQSGQDQTGAILNNNGGSVVFQAGAAGTGGTGGAANTGTFQFIDGSGNTIGSFGNAKGGGNGGLDFFTLGPNSANLGNLRLPTGMQIFFRNNANTGNIIALSGSVDKLLIGSSGTTVGPTSLDLAGQAMTLTIGDGTAGGANQIASFSSTTSAWTYPSTTTSVSWSTASTSGTTGASVSLTSQSATGTNATAGAITIQTGTGTLTGAGNLSTGSGTINLKSGNATIAQLGAASDDVFYIGGAVSGVQNILSLALSTTNILFGMNGGPSISQAQRTGSFIGTTFEIRAQPGGLSSGAQSNGNGGTLRLKGGLPGNGGSGAAGIAGGVEFWSGTTQNGRISNDSTTDFLHIGSSTGVAITPTAITMNGQALPLTTIKPPTGTGFAYVTGSVWDATPLAQINLSSSLVTGVLPFANMSTLYGDIVNVNTGYYQVSSISGDLSLGQCTVDANMVITYGNGLSYGPSPGTMTLLAAQAAAGNGVTFIIAAQQGAAATGVSNNTNGGQLRLRSGSPGTGGSGTAGLGGPLQFYSGNNLVAQFQSTTTDFVKLGAITSNLGLSLVPASITWASGQTSPIITQTILAGTGSTSGTSLTIRAQGGQNQTGAVSNTSGGAVIIQSGAAGTGGSGATGLSGNIQFYAGANLISQLGAIASDFISLGANVASTGYIRIANSGAIVARNAANSANIPLITTDSNDSILIGPTTSGVNSTLYLKTNSLSVNDVNNSFAVGMTGMSTGNSFVMSFDYGLASATIQHNQYLPSLTGATGAAFTIKAQTLSSGTGNTGGSLNLVGGNASTNGGDVVLQLGTGATKNGSVKIVNAITTSTAPSAGGGGALPATPVGYITVYINGTARQLAYY